MSSLSIPPKQCSSVSQLSKAKLSFWISKILYKLYKILYKLSMRKAFFKCCIWCSHCLLRIWILFAEIIQSFCCFLQPNKHSSYPLKLTGFWYQQDKDIHKCNFLKLLMRNFAIDPLSMAVIVTSHPNSWAFWSQTFGSTIVITLAKAISWPPCVYLLFCPFRGFQKVLCSSSLYSSRGVYVIQQIFCNVVTFFDLNCVVGGVCYLMLFLEHLVGQFSLKWIPLFSVLFVVSLGTDWTKMKESHGF